MRLIPATQFLSCFFGMALLGLCQAPRPSSEPPRTSIGFVLTGGGSFGAFEAGALQAYFDRWEGEHAGVAPPVSVIAGTSTGALIGPFIALGHDGVAEVARIYQDVGQGDILRPKASVFLPFFLFSRWSSSAFSAAPLAKLMARELSDSKLTQIAQMWPGKRLVVVATSFATGQPAFFTNAPKDLGNDPVRFRQGALASAISPLATPPVYIQPDTGGAVAPYLDGGIHAVAPFQALFDLAARSPDVEMTQVVVFSAFPAFPGSDLQQVQERRFPAHPQFGDIGARMDALISESSIAKEIDLAWAAITLRNAGVSTEKVRERTGLNIPKPPRELIVIAPDGRLGWDNLKFSRNEMREMFSRGRKSVPRVLIP